MSYAEALDQLLLSLHAVGTKLSEADGANHRAWGRHLLEDWRSLELIAEKLREVEDVDARD